MSEETPIKRGRGRPPGSLNKNRAFSEHAAEINALTPKALSVIKKFLMGNVDGMTPQQLLTAATKQLEIAKDLEKWQIDNGELTLKDKKPSEEEGVIQPLISTTSIPSKTIN